MNNIKDAEAAAEGGAAKDVTQ